MAETEKNQVFQYASLSGDPIEFREVKSDVVILPGDYEYADTLEILTKGIAYYKPTLLGTNHIAVDKSGLPSIVTPEKFAEILEAHCNDDFSEGDYYLNSEDLYNDLYRTDNDLFEWIDSDA